MSIITKRILSIAFSLIMVFSVLPSFQANAMTILSSYTATINGKKVTKDTYPGQHNCWKYANGIYKYIWGCYFTSEFTGEKSTDYNMLREMSDAGNRKISTTTVKNYLNAAALGAVIRVCRTSSTAYSDGSDGHSLILAGKDSKGCYFFEDWGAGSSGYGSVATYYTFSEFSSYFLNSKDYNYFKYIKWPNAPAFASDYKIKFNANGGSGAPSAQPKDKNVDINVTTTIPTRDGYAFVGWGLKSDDTKATYFSGDKLSENKNLTLYAVWKKAVSLGSSFTAKIYNTGINRWLTSETASSTSANLASYYVNNKSNQLFVFTKQSDGSYRIKNKATGYYMSVLYANTAAETNVKVFTQSSSIAQCWYITGSQGKYVLYSKCSDKPIEVEDASTKSGTNIRTNKYSGSKSQLFTITKDIYAPTITNVKRYYYSGTKFIATATVADNVNLKSVKAYAYTGASSDDSEKFTLTPNSKGNVSFTVYRSKHSYEFGDYTVKIYAYDSSNNRTISTTTINMPFDKLSPTGSFVYNNHAYVMYDYAAKANDAAYFSESLGGHLVSITSKGEQSAIYKYLSANGSKNYYWLGGYDSNKDNKFNWISKESFSYSNFAKNEPSSKSQQYLAMYKTDYSTANAGQWFDINADGATSTFYKLQNSGFVVEFDTISAPNPLTVSKSSDGLSLEYSKSVYADGYSIYRKNYSDKNYSLLTKVDGYSNAKYTDTSIKANTLYSYCVKTYVGTYTSKASTEKQNIIVATPTLKTVSRYSSSKIKLNWGKISGVTGYKIYRRTSSGSYTNVASLTGASKTSYIDSKLTKGKKYYYKIICYKTINSKTYYGSYSKAVSLTLK